MKKQTHSIFPIFIPHIGCPHQCVFCDQHTIAGKQTFDLARAEAELHEMLDSRPIGNGGEVAFFGGSFTGINRELMLKLLSLAQEFVDRGVVDGIRLSTRPDYVSNEILSILKRFSVKTVELGIQSLSDRVLLASGRGHRAEVSITACRAVKQAGFALVGQMMSALPASTPQDEIMTAERLCDLKVDAVRIYPTVVFPNTPLASMARRGTYQPPSQQEMVARCTDIFSVFAERGVPVIRIGLCSTEDVRASGVGFHDAIGELVKNELYRRRIASLLTGQSLSYGGKSRLSIAVAPGHTSLAVGHKACNKEWLAKTHGLHLHVVEDPSVLPYQPKLFSLSRI